MRRLLIAILVCLPLPLWGFGEVHIVLSEPGGAYAEVAEAIEPSRVRRPIKPWVLANLSAEQIGVLTGEANLIMPVGLAALRAVNQHHAGQASVLGLMVPRASSENLVWPSSLGRRKVSTVFVDQPLSRLVHLAMLLARADGKLGVLVSRDNSGMLKTLEQERTRHDLAIEVAVVNRPEDVGPALRRLLPEVQVMLLVPDAQLNAETLQHILLGSYRQRIPVVGFSAAQVRAGAAAAVYATPTQIGDTGEDIAANWKPERGDLPHASSPKGFKVLVNRQVTRSLDISLPDEEELHRQLAAGE